MSRRRGEALPPGFGIIWASVAVDVVGFGIVLPILPIYAKRFHASSLQAALLVTAFSGAAFVFSPLWGRLSDRIGRRPVILVSLAGTAAGSLMTGLATGLPLLYAGRLVDGASGASVAVAQAAVADLADPSERPRLFGLLGAAFGLGFVAGPAIGAMAALSGPRTPFFVAAALAGVNTVIGLFRLPETMSSGPAGRPAGPASSEARGPLTRAGRGEAPAPDSPAGLAPASAHSGSVLRRADVWPLLLVAFTSMTAFSGFEATFALFGQRHLGLTIGSAAAVFTAVGLVIVAVQGGVVHTVVLRFGEGATLAAGLGLDAAGLALLAPARSWALAAPALLLLTAGQGLVQTTMASALSARAGPTSRGRVLGAQQSASALARIAGPAIGGALLGVGGSSAAYWVGAALLGIALFVSFPAFRTVTKMQT
ncbi:MAG TPA: MFS transporter [Acidimicrobiales bacterium]|nr:MFS transporter [Acidimicrobiales bacterium]